MIALMTDDVRFFFDCANMLKEMGIPFMAIPVGDDIPSTVDVVLTTPVEAPSLDFANVVHSPDPEKAVKAALAHHCGRGTAMDVVIGIDPGPHPGMAVYADGILLDARRIDVLEDILREVESVLDYTCAERYLIRIGHQDETNRNRIINLLWPLGITVEVVKEHSTTVNSHTPNIDAAKVISRKKGKRLNWPPAVNPTPGELREVKRQSRIRSVGGATISTDLARKVAKGEMSMEEALEITQGKG